MHLTNLFSNIVNGSLAKRGTIKVKKTKIILKFLNILIKEGLIKGFIFSNTDKHTINILLKYNNNIPLIAKIKQISKPSKKFYISNKELYKKCKNSIYILSTTKGFITQVEAKQNNLGGELICKISIN